MKTGFICQSCGAIWPNDYIDQWGRKYGIGLGSSPCCEAMRSDYSRPIAFAPETPEKAMHPVGVCKGTLQQKDFDDYVVGFIPASSDPSMMKRADLIRDKQAETSTALKVHLARVKENTIIETSTKW